MHHLMMILSICFHNNNNPFCSDTESYRKQPVCASHPVCCPGRRCKADARHVTLQTRNPGTVGMTSSAQAELSSTLSMAVPRRRTMQTGRQVSLSLSHTHSHTQTRRCVNGIRQCVITAVMLLDEGLSASSSSSSSSAAN